MPRNAWLTERVTSSVVADARKKLTGPMRAEELSRATVGWNVRPLIEGWPLFVEAYGLLFPLLMAGTLALGFEIVAGRRRSGAAAVPVALALVAGLVFLHQPLNWPSTVDYNYTLRRKSGGEKLKLKKFCPRLRKHTLHVEKKK